VKIGCIIPAHLKSIRFPKKILFKIKGLEMIEHVRRRALLSLYLKKKVYVATGDPKILKLVKKNRGKVIKTFQNHLNGTSRVAEALKRTNFTHVIILQGDEPLIYPKYIDKFITEIKKDKNNKIDCWNLVSPITNSKDLKIKSFVKTKLNKDNYINSLSRVYSSNENKIFKILGLIALKRKSILKLIKIKPSSNEKKQFIEQLRIIENKMILKGVKVKQALPSINEKKDVKKVIESLDKSKIQKKIFKEILI
jgi:3-deoxy-manno-octulosonate cytidylyltransferase (CMP-KDO synthetase)